MNAKLGSSDTSLPREPQRAVHVTDKDNYSREEVARLIEDAVRQTVVAERAYLLAVLTEMQQRDALAALPPAKYLN